MMRAIVGHISAQPAQLMAQAAVWQVHHEDVHRACPAARHLVKALCSLAKSSDTQRSCTTNITTQNECTLNPDAGAMLRSLHLPS